MAVKQRKYTDLDLNFNRHPVTDDVTKRTDASAIIGSLNNLLNTNFYERPFRPDIGSNIKRMLFEPVDYTTTELIKREIEKVITNFEPRVTIDYTDVIADPDNHTYTVRVSFYILNNPDPINIQFFLERVR